MTKPRTWDGFGSAALTTLSDAKNVAALALLDVDGNGKPDLFVAADGADATTHKLFRNNGLATVFAATADSTFTASKIRALAVGDVNGDGFADLVAAVDGGPALLLLNKGLTTDSTGKTTWALLLP